MTRQRELIYDIIMSAPVHRTAEEIYDLARRQMPSLARGTVYRNLGILVQSGQIRKLEMPDAPARYDRGREPRMEDLIMPEGLLEPLIRERDVAVTGYDLKLYHICPQCRG